MVKKLKPDWDKEFNREQQCYKRLQPLQGTRVPVYYGEAVCDGTRAHVLSDVGGLTLFDANGLDYKIVDKLLKEAYDDLHTSGVTHDDVKLENYMLVGNKIMIVDFEMGLFAEELAQPGGRVVEEALATCKRCNIGDLIYIYRERQESLKEDDLWQRRELT